MGSESFKFISQSDILVKSFMFWLQSAETPSYHNIKQIEILSEYIGDLLKNVVFLMEQHLR